MSTRQSNTDPLLPLQDPEQLSQEIRRCARIEAALAAPTPISVPSPNIPNTNSMQNPPPNPQCSVGDQTEPVEMSNNDLIQAILVLQRNTAKQLLAAQEAAQARAELKVVQAQA
ncbi:hypothetical protein PTTG_01464 [Puccinia triticina 1-1 BBBD Race 1]|uniref:Uncharacterized protein n=1 Tax=Puccinia triticina (isolate 1-1 / race 1 (BBBD)) TaxID=630390 RepID=A0A0C4EL31_PUCT1|nr:hypothetical protein PTTG_01464 [Puccinia triticina 1-1 BBBD Race 1]